MKTDKRILAFVLTLALVFALAACSNSGSNDSNLNTNSNDGQVSSNTDNESNHSDTGSGTSSTGQAASVVIGITGDPGNISPVAANTDGNIAVRRSFYEPLMDKVNGQYEMVLMESYEVIDDLTFDVTIKQNIYDQAGNHMTADDVAFSYHEFRNINANGLGAYKDCEAIDEYTVRFYIEPSRSEAGALETITTEIFCVTEQAYNDSVDKMQTTPCGTGRYQVTDYITGASLSAKKADNYWNEDGDVATFSQANVDEITWMVIPETAQISIAIESGTIDASSSVNDADLANFENEDGTAKAGYTVSQFRDNFVYTLVFNCRDRETSDLRVRQAIAYCIDAPALSLATFGGNGEVAHNIGSRNYPDYDTALENEEYFEYNADKAKELLAEAGYENGGFTLELILEQGDYTEKMAQLIQAYCGAIGVTVNIHPYESALMRTITDSDEGDWDLQIGAVSNNNYLIGGLKNWRSTETNYQLNNSLVADPELNELINVGVDPETCSPEATTAVLRYMEEQCCAYGLSSYFRCAVANDSIANCVVDFRGYIQPGACEYAK